MIFNYELLLIITSQFGIDMVCSFALECEFVFDQ